ncbi:MAG: DNA polymerase III subunit beta [Pelotomaculum sp. PtaU1.Bin035]|nr:MAG: DNA polymerase III subunit beta [Pelotomaculum sp. PtaU1.Bin035]
MNFISSKEDLLSAVQIVQRAVSHKSPLPILSGIKFCAENDLLIVTATDLEIGIQCSVQAEIFEVGSVVLPAKYITEFFRRLPDVPIFIKSDPLTGNVSVKYGHSETNINGFLAQEFPELPLPVSEVKFSVPEDILKEAIRQVVFAVAVEESRPVFTGVLLEINGGEMQMAATDTHRLAWRKLKFDDSNNIDINIIIPGKTLNELSKVIGRPEKEVDITVTDNQVLFSVEDLCIISRLISGKFPPYRQVIPQGRVSRIRLITRELAEAVERAALFTTAGSSFIKLLLQNNILVVSVSTEVGRVYEEIPVYQEGEPMQVAVNTRYLSEALKVLGSGEINIEFAGPLNPLVLKPVEGNDYLSLLLPVRIREE